MHYRAPALLLVTMVGVVTFTAAQTDNSNLDPSTNAIPTANQRHLGMMPSLTGSVTGMDGIPLHDIRIEVHSVGTGALVATCFSNSVGGFELQNLRPGSYEIIAVSGLNEGRENVQVQNGMANVAVRVPTRAPAPSTGTVSVVELRTPEKARHLVEKAHEALARNHDDDALKAVNAALEIAPEYPAGLTLRAILELNQEHPDQAINDLDHAIKSDPSYGTAYVTLGAVYNHMGRFDDALRSLDRASIYSPKSWQCAFEMAKAYMAKRDYSHALQQINRADSLGSKEVADSIHLFRGYALLGQKEFAAATRELEAYLTAKPNGPTAASVRAALAEVKTVLARQSSNLTLTPAMAGFFGSTH